MKLSDRLKHGIGVYYAEINLVEEVERLEAVVDAADVIGSEGLCDGVPRFTNKEFEAMQSAIADLREAGLLDALLGADDE